MRLVVLDKRFLLFFLLFNLLLMHKFLLSILFNGIVDYEYIMGSWKVAQYFFSYFDEFIKRGLIGTFFDLLNINVSHKSIVISSLIISNVFFIIFYTFSNLAFQNSEKKYFTMFILLFILSPATVMHLGIDLGRYDHYMLLLFITSLILLSKNANYTTVTLPIILILGLLTHEIFLFFYAPIIFSIIYYFYRNNNINSSILYLSFFGTTLTLFFLFIAGKADIILVNDIKSKVLNLIDFSYNPSGSLQVWTRSAIENITLTLNSFTSKYKLIHILLTLPLLVSIIYIINMILSKSKNFDKNARLIFYSTFLMFPMYFLGTDSARWTALLIMNLFIVFLFLKYKLQIDISNINFNQKDKIIIIFIFLHTFLGPLGIGGSYDYAIKVISKLKGILF